MNVYNCRNMKKMEKTLIELKIVEVIVGGSLSLSVFFYFLLNFNGDFDTKMVNRISDRHTMLFLDECVWLCGAVVKRTIEIQMRKDK